MLAAQSAPVLSAPLTQSDQARLAVTYAKLPLSFEANQGQAEVSVKFLARGRGYSLFLSPSEAVLLLAQSDGQATGTRPQGQIPGEPGAQALSSTLRMTLVDAQSAPQLTGEGILPGMVNYFIGNDPQRWRTAIPTFAKVRATGVYAGIDLVYYGTQGQVEYDFIVAPGADPGVIRLAFEGAQELRLDSQGALVLRTAVGEVRWQPPVIYQEVEGTREKITGRYVRIGPQQVGFEVAPYDASRPLVIDPVLSYSTYLGGPGDEDLSILTPKFPGVFCNFGGPCSGGGGIAIDADHNVYVTGATGADNFPTKNAFQPTKPGANPNDRNSRAFMTKLNATGSMPLYSTYLGGTQQSFACCETAFGIAVDNVGHVYVVGKTLSGDFPTKSPDPLGAFQTAKAAPGTSTPDLFVAKFDPSQAGTASLIYSTYLGGDCTEGVFGLGGIAVDTFGNAYITSDTCSTNFPISHPLQSPLSNGRTYEGSMKSDATGRTDAFVAVLNPSGSALLFSTYLGGAHLLVPGNDAGDDIGLGIAVDTHGRIYVTGATNSPFFPTTSEATAGPYQRSSGSQNPLAFDAFVAKLDVSDVVPSNHPPVANAGLDQSVNETASVTLDGSGSTDPDGDALTYTWEQVAGTSVVLHLSDPVHPTFTAPDVPRGGATLTFQLTVSDGSLMSAPATVNLKVKDVNHPPVADAGQAQTVQEGSPVTLNGSNSYDPDSDVLTYSWSQTSGVPVSLSGANTTQPSFTAPSVGPAGTTLTFQLTVSDGLASGTATVNIMVSHVNQIPMANAGADQTIDEGTPVTLDGRASSDPDGDLLTYTWTQPVGLPILLSDPHSATPTFTAPLVGAGGATLEFQLIVNDGEASSAPDRVKITVQDLNAPPACQLGVARPTLLWPPDHKLLAVSIVGVADPDNDQVTITVTGVKQDEPVNGLGDGDTSPDAVLQGDTVLLRSERAGNGNGRVYHVTFRAEDGGGRSCVGTAAVCVPHDRKNDNCVDGGALYDSLLK